MAIKNTKQILHKYISDSLNSKAKILQKDITETIESRNNDTKSSAGDKFETGREMMNIEIQKAEKQLSITNKFIEELSKIDLQKNNDRVIYGSVVYTNNGNYFISIAFGKIEIENDVFYSISLASPLGKILQNKQVGNSFNFQKKEYIINKIM